MNAVLPEGVKTENRPTGLTGAATQPGRFLLAVADASRYCAAVLFVASPAASHMTGQTLVVDRGFLIS